MEKAGWMRYELLFSPEARPLAAWAAEHASFCFAHEHRVYYCWGEVLTPEGMQYEVHDIGGPPRFTRFLGTTLVHRVDSYRLLEVAGRQGAEPSVPPARSSS
jgi:hypothetical protein